MAKRRGKMQNNTEPMVSMKLPLPVHTAVKLMRKRYSKGGQKPKMMDALWQFIEEKDPELARDAESAAQLREKLATMLGEDDE